MTPRPSHRKRISALRLSSDTTHSLLPVYVPTPEDRPPDYEAGDEDSESDSSLTVASTSGLPVSAPASAASASFSPRRRRGPALAHHRKRKSTSKSTSAAAASSTDPYLDSLLARSVHALEMSNTLLQSSMSTQKSVSAMCAAGSSEDSLVLDHADVNAGEGMAVDISDTRAKALSRPRLSGVGVRARDLGLEDEEGEVQPKWAAALAEISRGVDGLFDSDASATLSSSLPAESSSPLKHAHRRRPSLLELRDVNVLHDLHAPLSSPRLTDKPFQPMTPAYNKLSSFVNPTPRLPSTPSPFLSRRSSTASRKDHSPTPTTRPSPHDRSPRSLTPKQIIATLPHHHHHHHHNGNSSGHGLRSMTPPTEESSPSSDDSCPAKLTVLSLRKILDEQPPPPPPPEPQRPRAPVFHPRTPAPMAQAETSTATASVSRLLTKNKHTSSTRPPSPPRQSAMKRSPSAPSTPTRGEQTQPALAPTPSSMSKASSSMLNLPDVNPLNPNLNLNRGLGLGLLRVPSWTGSLSSAPSSGRSTPKRISFAALPESYAGSRPSADGGRNSRKRRRKRGAGGGSGGGVGSDEGEGDEGGWWGGWFLGLGSGSGLGSGVKAHGHGYGEERAEERFGRNWGGRMPGAAGFGPGMDEWAI